jgi:hypothetical protein
MKKKQPKSSAAKPDPRWTPVPDDRVRATWAWPDGSHETEIDPWFYADAGIPVCGEGAYDGADMIYVRTEVRLEEH